MLTYVERTPEHCTSFCSFLKKSAVKKHTALEMIMHYEKTVKFLLDCGTSRCIHFKAEMEKTEHEGDIFKIT